MGQYSRGIEVKGDAELMRLATGFRQGFLGRKKSARLCFCVSVSLQAYLWICGIQTEVYICHVRRWEHFALCLEDGRILDCTAGQFKKPDKSAMPAIYIGKVPRGTGAGSHGSQD